MNKSVRQPRRLAPVLGLGIGFAALEIFFSEQALPLRQATALAPVRHRAHGHRSGKRAAGYLVRSFDHRNLLVVDGGFLPTSAAVNPALTPRRRASRPKSAATIFRPDMPWCGQANAGSQRYRLTFLPAFRKRTGSMASPLRRTS